MKKKNKLLVYFILICLLLFGCSKESIPVAKEPKEEIHETTKPKQNKKVETNHEIKKDIVISAQEGTPEWTFQHLVKAVEENDQVGFMKFQNKENDLFYTEQKRWIEEAIYKKEQGYSLSLSLNSFQVENDITGTIRFSVNMKHPVEGETYNTVTYECIKVNNVWLLNDLPFTKYTSNSEHITIYFINGQEDIAKKTLTEASDIVSFYSENFKWEPKPISIKIYPSNEEVSATVPWVGLAGWNEMGESLKITSINKDDIFRLLAHELTHKMLSDLTNDNASLYIQEGFATYLQNKVQRDGTGKIYFDQSIVDEKSKKAIEVSNSVLSIEELGNIDYTDTNLGISLYRDGSLISNYLVLTYGLEKYLEMLNYLSSNEYIDKRLEHKMDLAQKRTVEALEKVYGSVEQLSSNYQDYYLK